MSFVVFDTEYIADKGLKEEGFCGWQNREIIQIAALKIDNNLEVLDRMNLYILPKLHNEVPKYFVELTGISNESIRDNGIVFEEAYARFKKFVGNDDCYSHSWDDGEEADGIVMKEMLSIHKIEEENHLKYCNIAGWFKRKYVENNINVNKQSSGEIATILGHKEELEDLGLKVHNAFYDVYSILIGLRVLGFNK